MREPEVAEHFADLETQQHSAQLGMWVFLTSEVLLFAGLFGIWASYYTRWTEQFHLAIEHNTLWYGTANTFVLLTSSLTVALSLWALRHRSRALSFLLVLVTILLGVTFLVIKGVEYADHVHHGLLPGVYFRSNEIRGPGVTLFYTLYWLMTGLHALHMTVGIGVMTWLAVRIRRATIHPRNPVALELGAMYWHLVDIIWLFLWPLLYLLK